METPGGDLTLVQQGHKVWNIGIIFVQPPHSKWSNVWSVVLVADGRELILVIQTHRPHGELMLRDDLTLLGSTILRVAWEE